MSSSQRNRLVDVSVVTATYNRPHLLQHVWSSLKGQSASFEWIIVDDASQDNTSDVVSSFDDDRITYFRHDKRHGSPNPGRNRGAKFARGRYVLFLDDDDELYPGSMANMVTIMDGASPSVGVALFQCVLGNGRRWNEQIVDGAIYDEADIVCRRVLGLEKLCMYRKEVFDHFVLPEDLRFCEMVFVFAVSKQYKFLMSTQLGRVFHQHATNNSQANSMISISHFIAEAYERILHNHQEVLKGCPSARAFYITKALYRYAVASRRADTVRLFQALLKCGTPLDVARGTGILLLGLSGTAKALEKIRIPMMRRTIMTGGRDARL